MSRLSDEVNGFEAGNQRPALWASGADGGWNIFCGLEALEDRTLFSAAAPITPTLVTASPSGTAVQVTWRNNEATATGFIVLRSTDGVQYSQIAQLGKVSSYKDLAVEPSHTYKYEVKAITSITTSPASLAATATTAMGVPTGVSAALSGNTVNLAWSGSDNAATGYNILRSVDGKAYVLLTKVAGFASASYADATLTAGHTYAYRIQAYGATITSAQTAPVSVVTPLATPTGLSTAVASTGVILTWTANDLLATGYYILRSTAGGAFVRIATTAKVVAFTDTTVASSTNYTYQVQARNTYSTSAVSNTAAALSAMGAPSSVTATSAVGGVNVIWTSTDPTAAGFTIYRSTNGGPAVLLTTINYGTASVYADTTAQTGYSYKYTVVATNGQRSSVQSAAASVVTPLVMPTDLSAVKSGLSVALSWTASDVAATGYYVLRSTDNGTFLQVANRVGGSTTSYTDVAVTTGHVYSYKVQAYNAVSTSAQTSAAAASFPLVAPSNLAAALATATGSSVRLTWTVNDTHATGYYIMRSLDGVTWTRVGTVTGAGSAGYTDSTAKSSMTYQYQVQGYTAVVVSPLTSAVVITTPLGTPTSVAAALSAGLVNLTWKNADLTVAGYSIFRSVDGAAATLLTTVSPATTLAYVDAAVITGHKYVYTIRAYSANDRTSAMSGSASVITPLVAPTIAAAAIAGASMNVTWTAGDASAAGYRVMRSMDNGAFVLVTTINSKDTTSYTDSTVLSGHVYAYQVVAYNALTPSPASATATATMPLTAPTGLSAAIITGKVNLAWTAADANATGYNIMRSTDGATFTKIASVIGLATVKYIDTTAASGTRYTYQVVATRGAVVSGASASATAITPMLAPTTLTATVSGGNVLLKWTNKDATTTGYIVLRSTDGINYTQAAQIASKTTVQWVDTGTTAGQTCYYQVKAVNAVTNSAVSNTVTVGIPNGSAGGVTITTRYGNEVVITATGAADSVKVDQSGSSLVITANQQVFTLSLPGAGVFVYARGGVDTIITTAAVTVRTTIVSIDGAATTITSAASNVSVWMDSTDVFSGSGITHAVASYAKGVSKAVGAAMANPTDSGTVKKVSLSLWGTGPAATDVNQGSVGDCYFMATLAAFAGTKAATLLESAVDMGDGTYVVQYFDYANNNTKVFIRISNDFSVGYWNGGLKYASYGANNTVWAMVMEKAFAYFRTKANTYASISGGWMGSVYTTLGVTNTAFDPPMYTQSSFYAAVTNALAAGKPITFACISGPDMVNGHAYTLVSASKDADGTTHYVVRNPWGSKGGSAENSQGYATLTWAQMLANFQYGCVAM